MKDRTKTTYKRIAAATVTLDLLVALSKQDGPASAKDIAESAGIHVTTARGYLESLADGNAVNRVGTYYELGHLIAMIWARYRARLQSDVQVAQEKLEQIEVSNG